jgi:hypothetical protein
MVSVMSPQSGEAVSISAQTHVILGTAPIETIDLHAVETTFRAQAGWNQGQIFHLRQIHVPETKELLSYVQTLCPDVRITDSGVICRPPGCAMQPVHVDGGLFCLHIALHDLKRASLLYSHTEWTRGIDPLTHYQPVHPWPAGEMHILGGKRVHAGPANETSRPEFIAYFTGN